MRNTINTVQGGVRAGTNVQVQYLPYDTQVRNAINTLRYLYEIQYGGHLVGISNGSKSKKIVNGIIYHCAKFGAFFTKRTIPPKKLAMPLHYIIRVDLLFLSNENCVS